MIRVGDVMRGDKSGALYRVIFVVYAAGHVTGAAEIIRPARGYRGRPKGYIVPFGPRWKWSLVGRNYKAR